MARTITKYVSDLGGDRQWQDHIPPISIIIASFVFFVGTFMAMYLYAPNGGYNFADQFFSELGVRSDYVDPDTSETVFAPNDPEIFNYTLLFTGYVSLAFFPFTWRQMRNDSSISKFFFGLAIMFGTLAGPVLVGVGLIDLSVEETARITDHHFWAALLYLFIALTSLFWLLGLFKAEHLPYKKDAWGMKLEYFYLAIYIAIVIFNLVVSIFDLDIDNISGINTLSIEGYQKVMAYMFFLYFFYVGMKLAREKYDNTPV